MIDENNINWTAAWNAANHTFSCAIYNIKESQMEKWSVDIFKKILPRHFDLLNIINKILIEKVKKIPGLSNDEIKKKIKRVSIIEEETGLIRMTNLCMVACHKLVFSS